MHPPYSAPLVDTARSRAIAAALTAAGALDRRQLARLVHADLWGPGRFSPAVREAVAQRKVRRTGRGMYALSRSATGTGEETPPHDRAQHGDGTGEQP
jgi:hypothetical protein